MLIRPYTATKRDNGFARKSIIPVSLPPPVHIAGFHLYYYHIFTREFRCSYIFFGTTLSYTSFSWQISVAGVTISSKGIYPPISSYSNIRMYPKNMHIYIYQTIFHIRKEVKLKQKSPNESATLLQLRLSELETLKERCLSDISNSPDGYIRIQKRGKSFQYYLRLDPKDFKGKYVPKSEHTIVKQILQRDYSSLLINEISKEINLIKSFLEKYLPNSLENIYGSFSPQRKEFITPYVISEEEYARKWSTMDYTSLGFFEGEPELYTSSGLRVRSKSEILIAEALARHNVPFRYEYPLKLAGLGTVYPDFLCLNKRTRREYCWEHLGMMDNEKYVNRNSIKLEKYELNGFFPGINLILTAETSERPISSLLIEKNIVAYLK